MPTHYLYEHENPHAPRRSNGKRFHGYPDRHQRTDLVVVHDTESVLDTAGPDGGAENVARYQSTTPRPSSYHRIVDSDSTVVCLPDEATAFGAKGANGRGLHVSLAMRTVDGLSTHPEAMRRREVMLVRTARTVAEWCVRYGIPVRKITRAQYLAGEAGIVAHADVDPDRRTDPGAWFPWARFLSYVAARVLELTDTPPTPTTSEASAMYVVHRPDGLAVLLTGGRIYPLASGEVDALRAAGTPVNGVTDAQFAALERLSEFVRTGRRP